MPERVPEELDIVVTPSGVIHLVAKGVTGPRKIAVLTCDRGRWDAHEIARRLAAGFRGKD